MQQYRWYAYLFHEQLWWWQVNLLLAAIRLSRHKGTHKGLPILFTDSSLCARAKSRSRVCRSIWRPSILIKRRICICCSLKTPTRESQSITRVSLRRASSGPDRPRLSFCPRRASSASDGSCNVGNWSNSFGRVIMFRLGSSKFVYSGLYLSSSSYRLICSTRIRARRTVLICLFWFHVILSFVIK